MDKRIEDLEAAMTQMVERIDMLTQQVIILSKAVATSDPPPVVDPRDVVALMESRGISWDEAVKLVSDAG